ncbi:hypothetical protein HRR83_004801 [Exophiala dermatitidis]|uniref:Origin recognition complex subunit 5 n=2 Tax=Exophiala dermatitidis TaxID=5970 RepID=H6BS92_EXODN|nr:origin recognition complex subunit 5 [Exophiala dermatitidis NIH/UT8656]KAJ4515518.1 hypothetical protein HRR75_003597 [Exophiala dermatitidis]EHY54147.1 origin recognition complex subunit 5 [Exophiala dermatitidis NIH/UT8656]KAJ4519180.1 hypothetical protein HRR74_003921 [Exophiala dermatitidis]KAJ4528996.1 hypothetical protein HRR73_000016 [Exophiala dermatitidis]KAJ4538389.1 hypothetical protein HRR77_006877 [Exophiala dermatitidis]
MPVLLPRELVQSISQHCPCREAQILQLATYFNGVFPSPAVLVAYGLENSNKTNVITSVLEKREYQYAVIRSRECLSPRHLLSKIFAEVIEAFGLESQLGRYVRVDSLNALLENMRKISRDTCGRRFVVVIEDIDRLKQAGTMLLPALARLGDQIPGFSVIMTSSSPRPLILHRTGIPYVHFPPYTRNEAVNIVTSEGLPPLPNDTVEIDKDALTTIYAQFAVTVYDSLISPTSSTSIQRFRTTCHKLWPRFILPLTSGQEPPAAGRGGSWDFAKLIVQNRALFQSEGEKALHHTLPLSALRRETLSDTKSLLSHQDAPSTPSKKTLLSNDGRDMTTVSMRPPLLKHFSTLVLISSYLASYTPPKHDILLFSRLSSSSVTVSRKIRRLKGTPTRRKSASASTPTGTPSKKDAAETKSPRRSRTKSLLAASAGLGVSRPFTLERLVAILRAVHPHGIPNRPGKGVCDRVYRELGELERLRLVVRASGAGFGGAADALGGAGTSTGGADDPSEERWRINVSRDWVVDMGKVWGMSICEYEVDHEL